MSTDSLELVAFHLTGSRPEGAAPSDAVALRPALLANYTDISQLRYDYPLVLPASANSGDTICSLTELINDVITKIVPAGKDGEFERQHILRLEYYIRDMLAEGNTGSLSQLWAEARHEILSTASAAENEAISACYDKAEAALACDGELVDCGTEAPASVLTHAWRADQDTKEAHFRTRIARLILKLEGILDADYRKTAKGHAAGTLQGQIGDSFEASFDAAKLSKLLPTALPGESLPKARRQRIETALKALHGQRFFAKPDIPSAQKGKAEPSHNFIFDNCAKALAAFAARLPEIVELVKANAVGELEIGNAYDEAKHDAFFAGFNETSLLPEDLDLFPTYLVLLNQKTSGADEKPRILEALSSNLPIKILVQTDDILDATTTGAMRFSFGVEAMQLASMTVGLSNAYVLQSSASNLFQLNGRITQGMAGSGPALFSIFSGAADGSKGLPAYLTAATAMESRAFPSFTFAPQAGADWASRFCVFGNPQAYSDWSVQSFDYEDDDHQRASQDVAFTFVDFVASDARHARHFVEAPKSEWQKNGMMPAGDYLDGDVDAMSGRVPYVLMVDQDDVLRRLIVDETVIRAARRCREMWHSLQELGGINNSHAKKLLEAERQAWEEQKQAEMAELRAAQAALASQAEPVAPASVANGAAAPMVAPVISADAASAPEAVEAVAEEPVDEPVGDDPFIETPRCTTCNECTDLNNQMFAYNDNMQAYIADASAGTFRELVEAAETCQVAIIHPGKPLDTSEPGLDDLIKRAELYI